MKKLALVLLLSTVCFAAPVNVVAKLKYLSQSTSITPTSLINVPNGLYRVTVLSVSLQSGGSTVWAFNLNWSDDSKGQNIVCSLPTLQGQIGNCTFLVNAVPATPLTFSVDQGASPMMTYDFFITVEQLQ